MTPLGILVSLIDMGQCLALRLTVYSLLHVFLHLLVDLASISQDRVLEQQVVGL